MTDKPRMTATRGAPVSVLPTDRDLNRMRLSMPTEFQLRPKEVKTLRKRLYSINKDCIRRYRTMLDGDILCVWRIK